MGIARSKAVSLGVVGATDAVGKDSKASKGLGTIATTIAILRHLGAMEQPAGVNAIARDLNVPPSSCFKILKHLQQADLAEFDEQTKCYSLGSQAIVLAARALDPANAFSQLRRDLEEFSSQYAVSLGFWRRVAHDRVMLAGFIDGRSPMRIHMTVGQRVPLLIGAVGRAFAAASDMSEQDIAAVFPALRWQKPLSLAEYCAQVDQVRATGYAVDVDNFAVGVSVAATVLKDMRGDHSYGISAIRFTSSTSTEDWERIGEGLVQMADRLHARWRVPHSG